MIVKNGKIVASKTMLPLNTTDCCIEQAVASILAAFYYETPRGFYYETPRGGSERSEHTLIHSGA